jgi:tRNA (cytidine/uridine-2'-O-)-methyltransferase
MQRENRLDSMGKIGPSIELALYQPDIPQNAGAMLRLGACFAVPVHVIEPCGFVFGESRMRRAGMDYIDQVDLRRHESWLAFAAERRAAGARIILMTTTGARPYTEFSFRAGDTIVMGRESAGVPDDVHTAVDARLVIPMAPGARSLNVAQAAAIAVAEAMRQVARVPA